MNIQYLFHFVTPIMLLTISLNWESLNLSKEIDIRTSLELGSTPSILCDALELILTNFVISDPQLS